MKKPVFLRGFPTLPVLCLQHHHVCRLSLAAHEFPAMRSGFIHVPFIPEQLEGKKEGTPAMELSMIAKGLEAAHQSFIKKKL